MTSDRHDSSGPDGKMGPTCRETKSAFEECLETAGNCMPENNDLGPEIEFWQRMLEATCGEGPW